MSCSDARLPTVQKNKVEQSEFLESMSAPNRIRNRMTDHDEGKRRQLRKYNKEHRAIAAEWRERSCTYPPPVFPPFPDDLRGLRCGAKTRKGTPCLRKDLYESGRCKLHGGLSTGPTTEEGRERCRQAALRRWAKMRGSGDGTP